MIAVRLLWRKEVAAQLDQFGCTFIEEITNPDDDYYSASYWRTSWGHHFYVPQIGDDRLVPASALYRIMAELAALAPNNGD